MKDILGNELKVGDRVAKASRRSSMAFLEMRVVERVEEGKVYLSRPLDFMGREDPRPNTVPITRSDLIVVVP